MSFFGGAVVGVVVGLAVGVFLARRRTGASSRAATSHGPSGRGLVAIAMATVALVVSGVALVRSGHNDHTSTTATTATTTTAPNSPGATSTTAPAVGASSTTTTTLFLGATVTVPNVVEMTKDTAVATLGNVGLKATVETLPLANVPPGFVISQSPLPSAQVTAGSPVSLVVSSAS
jgi:hypothetical protein